jgi:regulator of RNase E activity RraA
MEDVIERFDGRPPSTAALCNQLEAEGLPGQVLRGISNLGGRARFVARAHTVRMVPTRAGLAHQLDSPPFRSLLGVVAGGKVLVVETQGRTDGALIGDLMATWMISRGVRGLVTDGAVRDAAGLAKLPIVVRAAGVTPAMGSTRLIVAAVQCPVVCGGVTVTPGDVLAGDEDATVVLPAERADDLLRAAAEREDYEEYVAERLSGGDPPDGLMPPDESARAAYERWAARRGRHLPDPSTAGAR